MSSPNFPESKFPFPPAASAGQNTDESIRVSEATYRRLFETARDGILLLDGDTGIITKANPFLLELLDFSHEEIIGKTLDELSPFKALEPNKAMLERLQKEDVVRYEDVSLEKKEGRHISVDFVCNRYQSGDRQTIQCNIRDITARKQAEAALNRMALIVESSEEAIISKDLAGVIKTWNQGAENMFGYTAKEMVGASIVHLIPASHQGEELEIIGKIKRGESVDHLETIRQTKDGRLLNVMLKASPIKDATGTLIGVSKVAHDITDRKKAEDEILRLNETLEQQVSRRTAQLQDSVDELGAFSYSVSHDLRAPLRQIMGFVKLLQTSAGDSLGEKDQRFLNIIFESANRMGDLIDDLLTFARVGYAALRKTDVSMANLFDEAIRGLQTETGNRKIVWKIQPLPVVQADPALIRLVLDNLVANAVKFTSTRAEAVIEIGVQPSGSDETVIFIRDNGVGFDQKYVAKLFGVFQRLHGEEEFEGTGIGLANVQRIIHRHGGQVWAEGRLDQGANFFFSIPHVKEGIEEIAPSEAPAMENKSPAKNNCGTLNAERSQ